MTDQTVNAQGLTLAEYRQKALDAEAKYGDCELIDLGTVQDLFDDWQAGTDPELLIDTAALAEGLAYVDPDYEGKVLRYWTVIGRLGGEQHVKTTVAYDQHEAAEDFYKRFGDGVGVDLVVSCGREYPDYYTVEEL